MANNTKKFVKTRGSQERPAALKKVIACLVVLLLLALIYYIFLPALNLVSLGLWAFVMVAVLLFSLALSLGNSPGVVVYDKSGKPSVHRESSDFGAFKIGGGLVAAMFVIFIIIGITGVKMFNADIYKDLIVREEGNFTDDIAELSMNQIPVVDRDTAMQLGKRKMGNMNELVSQFEVADDYTQINYNNRPIRVTPLRYADLFKWLSNQKDGVPAYIKVDMVTQDTSLVQLEKSMKYGPHEMFSRDLARLLRFAYPTKMFDDYSFEIDDNDVPYWIAPTICYRVSVWGGRDINGAVLVNAITGEHTYYDLKDIPQWADRIFRADLIVEQLDYNGALQDGYWNSVIGQRGVLQTTEGYNYLAINDDVYLYTGMTSVTGDESNVGFVLVNMRTKETKFYSVPGAEEYSAMSSAEGQVQHLGYTSTFPLLLNVADRPTYFMSLKDAAGLVKMYAFVDVEQYQIVGTGPSVTEARTSYVKALTQEDVAGDGAGNKIEGKVAKVASAVVDGSTNYYIQLEGSDVLYVAGIQVSQRLAFLQPGDTVSIAYSGAEDTRTVLSMEIKVTAPSSTTQDPSTTTPSRV